MSFESVGEEIDSTPNPKLRLSLPLSEDGTCKGEDEYDGIQLDAIYAKSTRTPNLGSRDIPFTLISTASSLTSREILQGIISTNTSKTDQPGSISEERIHNYLKRCVDREIVGCREHNVDSKVDKHWFSASVNFFVCVAD